MLRYKHIICNFLQIKGNLVALHKIVSTLTSKNKLTQADIVEGLSIMQPQLSKWLRTGFLLNEERQALVMRRVIDLLKTKNKYELKENQEGIAALEAYLSRAEIKHSKDISPNKPIYPNYPTYLLREAEPFFKQRMVQTPFQFAVMGGKKMGKSSFLLYAQQQLEPSSTVLTIDCDDFDPAISLEQSMAKTIMKQCAWVENKLRANNFVKWFEANVLVSLPKETITLMIDHMEVLDVQKAAEHFQLLRRMMNLRASNASFKKLNLMIACDEAFPCHPSIDEHSSSYVRAAQMIDLDNFSDNNIEKLAEVFLDEGENIDDEKIDWLTEHFSGHPYLTYQAIYHLQKGVTEQNCLALLDTKLWEDIFQPMQNYWPPTLITKTKEILLQHEDTDALAIFTGFSPLYQDCLSHSGLFNINDKEELTCVSLWVQNTLIKYFNGELNV